jgi:hypothetical protein
VATDHVGVSASDRISPSSATAAEPSPPAISPPAWTRKTKAGAAAGSPSLLPPSPYYSSLLRTDQPHLRVSHWHQCHGRTEVVVALGGKLSSGMKTKTKTRPRRCGNVEEFLSWARSGSLGVTPSPLTSVRRKKKNRRKREGKWGILE